MGAEIGVPPNHPFSWDFPLSTIHLGVTLVYGNLHIGTTEDNQLAGVGHGISALRRMRPLGGPTSVESIETCSCRDQIALGDG